MYSRRCSLRATTNRCELRWPWRAAEQPEVEDLQLRLAQIDRLGAQTLACQLPDGSPAAHRADGRRRVHGQVGERLAIRRHQVRAAEVEHQLRRHHRAPPERLLDAPVVEADGVCLQVAGDERLGLRAEAECRSERPQEGAGALIAGLHGWIRRGHAMATAHREEDDAPVDARVGRVDTDSRRLRHRLDDSLGDGAASTDGGVVRGRSAGGRMPTV